MAPTKKGPGERKPPVKLSLLTDVEKQALREEARRSILEDMKQDARDAFFAAEIAKIRRENTPSDQIVHVSIDIAPFLPYIAIDGTQYFHGYSYDVPRMQALVIYEQMQRSWQHQDEIDGRSRFNPYRRAQNVVLGPRRIGQVTQGLNGAVTMPEDTMEV